MYIKLTLQEKLKDERTSRHMTLAELEKILGGGLSGKERTQAGMLLDQARWKEAALYMEGVKDGIRIAKWVCGI